MKQPRKTHDDRESEIMLAIVKIEKGKSKTGESKVSISAVAREVGISPALIHNHYPKAAEAIRVAQGRSSRMQRDIKQDQLKEEMRKSSDLRLEVKELRSQIAKLASINEILLIENQQLKTVISSPNIASFKN
ncbi:TPA: TetR family transcriptional regulator [Pseudomonas aeruginosa]